MEIALEISKEDIDRFWLNTKREGDCILYTGCNENGYCRIRINNVRYLVHRLSLYLSTGEWGEVARHKCRNRNCVNPDHLEWGNTTENSHDRYRDNTMPVGEKCHLSKLTDTQVLEIREKYVPYHCTSTILSDEYGVYKSTIKKIISRSIWKHI